MLPSALSANVVSFARLLRALGLDVTPAHVRLFIEALALTTLARRDDVKAAGRAIFARRVEHGRVFDRAFDAFWRADVAEPRASIDLGQLTRRTWHQRARVATWLPAGEAQAASEAPTDESLEVHERRQTWSDREVLRQKDFSELTADEQWRLRDALQTLVLPLAPRRTRRTQPARRGRLPDLRRTIRRSLRHGGEPLHLLRRERRARARPLVVLADVSGSMQPYARILLQFAYAMARVTRRAEVFTFGTRLTRLTRQLEGRDADLALLTASRAIADWGGGTRMGDALARFNRQWGKRVLGRGAVVLLMSDGWDRGDPAVLAREVAHLGRTCHRLIWLNPLLGQPGFEPLTRGLVAALPYVDDFLPVHNLASLEQLTATLARVGRTSAGSAGWPREGLAARGLR